MNHEHPSPGSDAPRHRAEPQPQTGDAASDAYVAHVAAHAPTPEAGHAVTELYARHGAAFAIYLALDGSHTYIRDYGPDQQPTDPAEMEASFTSCYHGHYPDRDAFLDDVIESLGWQHDLDRLLKGHPDLAGVVTLDRDAIYAMAYDHYEIIHSPSGFYIFERWP